MRKKSEYLWHIHLFEINIENQQTSIAQRPLQNDDHAQRMSNRAISLVVSNVIPHLIGPSAQAPITLIMYHVGEGTRPCSFPVTGNRYGHG